NAFALAMVLSALRRKTQIETLLTRHMKKPLHKKGRLGHSFLLIGATQLLFMEVDPHAALSATIDGVKMHPKSRFYQKLVNAVLRKLTKEVADKVSIENTPPFLMKNWVTAYGKEKSRKIALTHLEEPPLDITLKTPSEAEEWAERLNGTILPNGSIRIKKAGAIEKLAGFEQGAWCVQEAAASFPISIMGADKGARVLDLCAAPGGKTAQLAAKGAEVTAVENTPARLQRMEQNLTRLKLTAELVEGDILQWEPPAQYPFILLDAPCSASGTMRRHPDIAWHKHNMEYLTRQQDKMLTRAADWLEPGGIMVYCTCSLDKREGEERVEHFLTTHPSFETQPINFLDWQGKYLRSLPSDWSALGGLDGFFIAKLARR
ncbi:MAG: RsmB/NOP family class I SAM-dependent RNA methyltransferase, partial [Parvibaculales bacterium]